MFANTYIFSATHRISNTLIKLTPTEFPESLYYYYYYCYSLFFQTKFFNLIELSAHDLRLKWCLNLSYSLFCWLVFDVSSFRLVGRRSKNVKKKYGGWETWQGRRPNFQVQSKICDIYMYKYIIFSTDEELASLLVGCSDVKCLAWQLWSGKYESVCCGWQYIYRYMKLRRCLKRFVCCHNKVLLCFPQYCCITSCKASLLER